MTTQEPRRYKTIFFDLDGTLLPIDMDTFLREYFSKLKACSRRIRVRTIFAFGRRLKR